MEQRSVSARWDGALRAVVDAGGFPLVVDEPASVGGTDLGPQPTDLLLASIASCFTIALAYVAGKRGTELPDLQVRVVATYDGPRFTAIAISVSSTAGPDVLRGLIPHAERVCYVTNTLRQPPEITVGVEAIHSTPSTRGPELTQPPLVPPFTEETARLKVQAAEDAWNSRDPERVSRAYTEDSVWRNRHEFLQGREAIIEFLRRKWARELDYRLKKELWAYTGNHISVRFEYESHDAEGQWWRSHGNEHWEFDDDGLMRRRDASINDYPINESDRRIR